MNQKQKDLLATLLTLKKVSDFNIEAKDSKYYAAEVRIVHPDGWYTKNIEIDSVYFDEIKNILKKYENDLQELVSLAIKD